MNSAAPSVFEVILVWLIPGLFAIVVHECAHGWVALRLGDTTARDAGRLTLNPLRHIDLLGTLVVPGLMLLAKVPFLFGWAKPVPVNFQRLRGGRRGAFLVVLAGPLSNLMMLLLWLAVARVHQRMVADVADAGVMINLALMLLNLIPLPPLDGGRIVGALLPDMLRKPYMALERYGIFVLLLLIATGAFQHVFEPLLEFFASRLGLT
jgi:Zn-dependent protease